MNSLKFEATISSLSYKRVSWLFARIKIGFLLILMPSLMFGAGYQIFPTLAYNNAAELSSLGKYRVILGGTEVFAGMQYTGFVGTQNSSATSETSTFLPYLSAAYRVNSKWVTAFDVTHPVLSNIQYPQNSFVSPVAIDDIIFDTNYSPKVSIQLTDKLFFGLGFDANNITNAQINFGSAPEGEMINKSQGWGYGWDAGVSIQLNEANFLGFSYYSKINFGHLTGYSQLAALYQNNFSDNLVIPTTWTLNLTHQLHERWLLFETLRYIQWSQERYLGLQNSADGNLLFPLNYNDSGSILLGARYQWLDNIGITGVVEYDTNPQPTKFRPIALPACSLTLLGSVIDYAVSKQWSANLRYAFIFANPRINQTGPPPQMGHVAIYVNTVDIGLTWKV